MARDLGEFEHGGVSESDARRVILVLFYWGHIIIGFMLLFMNSFGSIIVMSIYRILMILVPLKCP